MTLTASSFLALIGETLKRLFADEAIPLAGNIAFRVIFSVFPFLIFLTSVAGFFGSEDLAKTVVNFLLDIAPAPLVTPFAAEIRSILTVPRAGLLSIAALLTIWTAMGGVDSVRVCLNRAYNLKERRPLWLLYLQNVGFVIGATVLMLVVALLLVVLPAIAQFFGEHSPAWLQPYTSFEYLRYPFAILLLGVGLITAHKFLPSTVFRTYEILPGIGLTVVAWVVLTEGFSWYLRNFNSFASTYASLSGLFAMMFFIYLAALALIFGGEVNRVFMQMNARKMQPNP